MLLAATLAVVAALADKPPSRRELAAWCLASEGTPDVMRCDDYILAITNLIDRSRLSMGMPQCIPAAAKPADLRRLSTRALMLKRPGNLDGPEAIVAGAFVDAFGCTSDPKGRATSPMPPGRPRFAP